MREDEIRNPTDALIGAMEEAERLRDVIVIGRYKEDEEESLCIYCSTKDGVVQTGMLELAKKCLLDGRAAEDE